MKHFDVIVVGAGPAGSICALSLVRTGATVGIVDKSRFPRDKACGDVIGPKAVRILRSLGITRPESALEVSDVNIIGPGGSTVRLPSEQGLDYDGVGWSSPREIFDNHLLNYALESGAEFVNARVGTVALIDSGYEVALPDGRKLHSEYLVGADGAISTVAQSLELVDPSKFLLGFAVRTYLEATIELPTISLWEQPMGRLFPGYGWAFPSAGGRVNLGVGVGVGSNKRAGSIATKELEGYYHRLANAKVVSDGASPTQKLGGWLKMGTSGTMPGKGRALLVGDAAGLVNPLQGEGIAQAIASSVAAARVIEMGILDPAALYRRWIQENLLDYQKASSLLHRIAIANPRLALAAMKLLFNPVVSTRLDSAWGIFWNDLADGAGTIRGARPARLLTKALLKLDTAVEGLAPGLLEVN